MIRLVISTVSFIIYKTHICNLITGSSFNISWAHFGELTSVLYSK